MANREEIALMAHLMRRASFGATREELEARIVKGYEATVEELVDSEEAPAADVNMLVRYHPEVLYPGGTEPMAHVNWMYHLLNTDRLLEEKMVLFWHQVFATGNAKVDSYAHMLRQIALFRRHGMGNFRDFLVELAKNPAMIFWLDNNENHKHAVNENWGRELLELFSIGVGNYTEEDVREDSRAFTGWTMAAKIPRLPYSLGFHWRFEYKPEDHDEGEKSFLGHDGHFNGEDIIDIIIQQPACARFIARHLYSFFVADEPQVPSWSIESPRDPEAIDILATALIDSKYEMRPVLRILFNSHFFKEALFAKVKSPAEVVVGTLKLVGGHDFPSPGIGELSMQPSYLGQDLLNPPSVEGWHTGSEWINSGSLMSRINFVADWKNHRVQKFSPAGAFLATFGTFGTGVGELNHPTGVAVDGDGDVYVCDWANNRVHIFGPDRDVITSLFGDAHQLSKWAQETVEASPDVMKGRRRVKSLEPESSFDRPSAVAFDEAESRVFVADCERSRLQIYIKEKDYADPQFNL